MRVVVFWPQEQFRRCYIEAFSVNEPMLSALTLPFARFTGEYAIKYMACAVSAAADGKTELYMETDPIRRQHLQSRLEECGARHVVVHSFPRNDAERLAGKFLGRVLGLANDQADMTLYTRGRTDTVVPSAAQQAPPEPRLLERAWGGEKAGRIIFDNEVEDLDEAMAREGVGSSSSSSAMFLDCAGTDGSPLQKKRQRVEASEEADEDQAMIIEILGERARRFEERMLASEARLATKEAEVEALLAEKANASQPAPGGGGGGGNHGPASAAAAALEHAKQIEELVAEQNRRRRVFEHDVAMHNEVVQQALKMGDMYKQETRKEVERAVRRVRREYQARLDAALAPKTPAEQRVRELEAKVLALKVKAAEDAAAMAELHEELAQANSRLDDFEEQQQEEGEGDDDDDATTTAGSEWGGDGTAKRAAPPKGCSLSQLRERLAGQRTEIADLKECFANASRMRNEAWMSRDEARARAAELEKRLEEKDYELRTEVNRLKTEVGRLCVSHHHHFTGLLC